MNINIMEIEKSLIEKREDLINRIELLHRDKCRVSGPLTQDTDDQATIIENDQVVDYLDDFAYKQFNSINNALERIKEHKYGVCVICGDEISEKRIKALPYEVTCISCAQDQ